MEQMRKTVFTPPQPHTCKPLLNEPFADTFDHPASNWQVHLLVAFIVNMILMRFQVGDHIRQRFLRTSAERVGVR